MNSRVKELINFIKYASIFFFVLLLAQFTAFLWLSQNALNPGGIPVWFTASMTASFILMFIYQSLLLYTDWIESWIAPKPDLSRSAAIAFGFVSLIMISAASSSVSIIKLHSKSGIASKGSWIIIFISLIVLFLSFVFSHLSLPLTKKKSDWPMNANDDIFFVTLSEVGAVNALIMLCAAVVTLSVPALRKHINFVSLMFAVSTLLPWGAMMFAWYLSRKKKVTRWSEEKHFLDMGRAAILALACAVGVSLMIFVLGILIPVFNVSSLWFPLVYVTVFLVFCGVNALKAVY